MGYGSQDGYDWMMDGYGLGYNRDWWMPPPIDIDYDTSLITGDDFLTSADPDFGGFTLGFDDVGNAFEVLDKDIFNDFLTYQDYSTLTNLGLDADAFITDSFGADALEGLLINGEDIDPTLNPSISRKDILRMTPTSQAGHERKMLAARDELVFQEQKRAQDNIRNQIDKAYGFASAETTIDPNTGQLVGVGSFYDRENASELSLGIATEDLRAIIQDFVDSPNYDGRFSEYSTGEISEDLINDFRYGVDEITEGDVEEAVKRIDLTFGSDSGETRTNSGYFVAVALDLLGMNKVGTSLYLTQSAYNYVINGVERITNKILGTGFDFPNLNVHEIAAEVLNQKFKDKDGNPILEGVADKTSFLFPFHDPEVAFALSSLGGENLGKFDPTGENIFENIGDALLEGNILDAVQEQSEAGKFEGVEANRRTGAVGLLDNVSSFIQGLGVAGQKIFGPVLSQIVIDNAIFKGYPVSELLNGISNSIGPQSAKDWVRYFENKGIDPNAVEEKDISWWRKTFDDYLKSDEYTASGKTGLDSLLDNASEGGLQAKYLSALNNYIEGITNKSIDRMQPAEFISVLNDQVQSAINRGEINDLLADESKLLSNLSIANYAAEQAGEPPMSLSEYRRFLEDELKINQTGQVTFGDNNEYYFDLETVNNLKEAFPDISDSDYQAGFDYLISEGEQGQAFTEGVGYDITPDAVFYASDYVDEGDYIVMRDVPAVASYFEYRTSEQGDEFVYDPMSGVTYEFEQARLFDEPGTRDDLYTFPSLSAEDLRNSDRTLNKEILKELVFTGKLEYKELKDLVTLQPELFGTVGFQRAYDAIDLELGDFFLKKYAGLTDEQLNDFELDDFLLPGKDLFAARSGSRTNILEIAKRWNQSEPPGSGGYKMPSLEFILMLNGYTDQDFNVLPSNEAYNEDYAEESIFELRPFEVTEYENGVPLIVEDTIYGFKEDYDPNRLNQNTGEYLFRAYSFDELKFKHVGNQSRSPLDTNAADRAKILKSLLEQGKITEQEVTDLDWSYYLARNPPIPPAGYDPITEQPYGNFTTIDDVKAEWNDLSIFSNEYPFLEDAQNWRNSEQYLGIEEIDLDTPIDYVTPVESFYDLPDFVVTDFDDINTLGEAYQDRLDFIDETNFDFGTKEFLKDSASRLYESRKAFIELDESSQQLILDAQAEATSDFVDLGVFNVTSTNLRALDAQLNARMNIINAADLSEEQKQYEIDLANAIYDSKKTELDLISSKNRAVNLLESQLSTAQTNYGIESQKATALQNRIDKIESYELPEFNVTAYMNAEDPSAYMQNFVDEVMKGTTEEFGNFLSVQNADQILANVAALAQSETDLEIAETAQQTNYDNYQEYLRKYNTAYAELTTANETLDANKIEIAELRADLYVELDNFEVTATDIDGAQNELDAFNQDIDNRVTNGEITSEQGELEKSLATNTFNVYKATQDIASLQTSKDTAVAKLEDDLRIAKDEAASFEAEADDFEEKFNTAKAQYEATQSFTMPDFNVYSAMEEMGYDYSDEKGYFENPLGLEQVATRDAWVENYEESLRDKTTLSEQQISDIIVDVRGAIFARQSRAFWKGESKKHEGDLAVAKGRIGELETYTLPDFTIEGVAVENLDSTLTAYQQALTDDFNAQLINQQQYDNLYNTAYDLVEGQKDFEETKEQLETTQSYILPDFNTYDAMVAMGYNWDSTDKMFDIGLNYDNDDVQARETYLDNYEQRLIEDGVLTEAQRNDVLAKMANALWSRQSREHQRNLFKNEQKELSEAQSRIGELESYTLPDFTVEGVPAENLDDTLSAYEQALTNDKNAGLINQEQYDTLYSSASELVQGEKDYIVAEENFSDKERKLTDKYNALQAKYTDYELPNMTVTGTAFSQAVQSEEIGYYYDTVDGYNVLRMPDVPAEWTGTPYEYRKSLREQLVSTKREEFYDAEGNSVLTEAQIDDLMDDYRYAIEYWQSRQGWYIGALQRNVNYDNLVASTNETIQGLEEDLENLQTFSLPEFNITATNQVELDAYLNRYQGYVDQAEKDENISAEQALNFDTIIASIRNNGSQIFNLEAENKTKQDKIDDLEGENTGLRTTIGDNEQNILDLTGTISVIGSGFDVNLYDDISDLDAGLALYIQGINDSDLDEEMKASQIAFAESMADMRRENLFVPTYEAPDFNVIAEGDLTGLNQSYAEAMFTLDSFLGNEYITQEEYDANVTALNESYNTRKETLVPVYTLPEFTVSDLDAEGGFTNLDSEKQSFIDELQGFLDSDYITREEYDSFEAQIESAYDTKKRDITPVYEAPDFTVYGQLEPGGTFEDIDTAYDTAFDELTLNAQLGYISTSDYITQLNDLQTSYRDARKGIAPAYELPDFSVYGQIAEGDDTTEIDTAYQNELTRLEQYKDSGYISLSEYYGFLGDLETEYTSRREGILPTYTMPDFGVTPASSLAELAEMEQAALDRFEMFSKSEYFPGDFDILAGRDELMSLIDAERARIQGTYTLPEFAVTDTQGVLTQKDIEDLFSEYESGLETDVLNEMLGFDDFMSAMDTARGTFEFEYDLRKPIQPRPGDYAIIPDENNEGDQPSTGDFIDFVDDGGFPDQTLYGGTGGIDTSGILTGNYMAKLDPAYQLAEMLLGQDAAREMYPTGKSRGLADEEFQSIVNQFMLGQAEAGFEMQSGLSGKMQDLATEQRRLQRQSDLDLMSEFGDPYKKQLEELYPEQAAALKQQREIADISAERAKGDLSPREQAQVEQQGYLYGAGRGREFDPVGLYQQLGEESSIRQQRETQATNQLTSLMNMERGMYGDLPSVIGAQSPFIEGVGDIQTPFNIGGIMDLGSVDYANEQKLKEVNMAIAQLDRDYQTAVALNQPSKAQSTLVRLNQFKEEADALSAGLSAGAQAFGTLKSIGGGIMNLFNPSSGSTNRNSFNYGSTTPVDYTDKGSFERYLFGMGF